MNGPGLGTAEAPREVLEGLRAIDPDADLVHLGGEEWLLGVRRPNPAAQERLQAQLRQITRFQQDPARVKAAMHVMGKELQLLQFFAQGFRPIHIYETERPGHDIVNDFRMRDFNWRTRPEEAVAEMKDAINLELGNKRKAEVFRDFALGEGPALFRHVMKRAVSAVVGALPWRS